MHTPDTVLLSHHGNRIKTVYPMEAPTPCCPLYSEGLILQHYTERGMGKVGLDRDELRALLRVLPSALLLEVLSERELVLLRLEDQPATLSADEYAQVFAEREAVTLDLDDPACTTPDEEPVPYTLVPGNTETVLHDEPLSLYRRT